jgi:hypothetical protein
MRKDKLLALVKIALVIAVYVGAIIWGFAFVLRVAELPEGARDGTWAAAFLESNHPRVAEDIEHLAEMSELVLRVSVLDRRIEVFGGGDTERGWFMSRPFWWHGYFVYQLDVLEVYKGSESVAVGDMLEIFQFSHRGNRSNVFEDINSENLRWFFDYIYADINVGDELVVFLVDHRQDLPSQYRGEFRQLYLSPWHIFESRDGDRVRRGNVNFTGVRRQTWGRPARHLFVLTNQVQATFRYLGDGVFEATNPLNNLAELPSAHLPYPPQECYGVAVTPSFAESDILPFIYKFPTVPRINSIMGWPMGGEMFETNPVRLTCSVPLMGDYELAINRFKGLMYLSGFERVTGVHVSLCPNTQPCDDGIVFRQGNVFVSLELRGELVIDCGGFPHSRSSTVRMAKLDNITYEIVDTDISMLSADELDFLSAEAQLPFFWYDDNILWTVGMDEGHGGIYDALQFSFQQIINRPPVHIHFNGARHQVEFLYELDTAQYYAFLYDFANLMAREGFTHVSEFTPLDIRIALALQPHLPDAQIIYTRQQGTGGWDVFINEKSTNSTTRQFTITVLNYGLGLM